MGYCERNLAEVRNVSGTDKKPEGVANYPDICVEYVQRFPSGTGSAGERGIVRSAYSNGRNESSSKGGAKSQLFHNGLSFKMLFPIIRKSQMRTPVSM